MPVKRKIFLARLLALLLFAPVYLLLLEIALIIGTAWGYQALTCSLATVLTAYLYHRLVNRGLVPKLKPQSF